MKILAIETSCDETAVSILEGEGSFPSARFRILGNALLSQVDVHKEYGGVFPAVAKREHSRNLVPLLETALLDAGLFKRRSSPCAVPDSLATLLEREPDLYLQFKHLIPHLEIPPIDAIAVTNGPGLEPALWVGINFAKALSLVWEKPVIPVNHMEGHLMASLLEQEGEVLRTASFEFPVLSLLISGGHTDLILMKEPLSYQYLGRTRDDAVGEAFDKTARLLGLPYPGGPEISRLASRAREKNLPRLLELPRPMLHSGDFDFSFSGLKTAVLYYLKERGELHQEEKEQVAREFEDAAAGVLAAKADRALGETGARTLALGGGVSANTRIRELCAKIIAERHPGCTLLIPSRELTTDNALMIAVAGFFRSSAPKPENIVAQGTLSLASA